MKNPKIMYILIIIFCIFAIVAGVYAQLTEGDDEVDLANREQQNTIASEKTQDELKSEFELLFTNTLNLGNFDTTGIAKINAEQNIVYEAITLDESTDRYEMNLHIPVINVRSELSNQLNLNTQNYFINKANEIIQDTESKEKIIYSVDYVAYVNDDILSLIIKSTLKEGDSAQRIIVQTYNYNLSTNQEASLVDLLTLKRLNRGEVNNKILEVVTAADEADKALEAMGYNQVYIRDLASDIYTVDNAGAYFLGPNGELYIVYAYGNGEFTSKMDIVFFE